MSEQSGNQQHGPLAPKKTNLLKSSVAMASGTLISRLLGFVKSALLVAAIGVTAGTAAAFNLANTLPNMVYNLLAAGIVNAILIPQIVRALKSKSGSEYVSKLLTAAGTILFGVTVAALAATPLLITILAPTLPGPVRALTISFALICVPQIFFYGVYNLLGELLNARGIFGPYMWAPVANNVVAIASLVLFLVLWGKAGEVLPADTFTGKQILVLAGGSTLGVIIQALVLFIPLRKAGVPLKLDFRFKGTNFGSAPKVAGWTFATLLVSQLGVVSTTNLASRGDTFTELTGEVVAGLQAYQYAFMLFMVPQSLIAVTLATAMFTAMANDVSNGDFRAVAASYHRGVQLILMLSFAAVSVMMVAGDPLMTMLMPGFGPNAASQYGAVLVALMLGLPSIGINLMSQRMFFALENARPVFLMGLAPIALQLVVGWGIYFQTGAEWWTVGAATAETVGRIVLGFISIAWVARAITHVSQKQLVGAYLKYFGAFVVSAVTGWMTKHFILPPISTGSTALRFFDAAWQAAVLSIVVLVIYFAALRVIDPEGFRGSVAAVLSRVRPSKEPQVMAEVAESLGEEPDETQPGSFAFEGRDLLLAEEHAAERFFDEEGQLDSDTAVEDGSSAGSETEEPLGAAHGREYTWEEIVAGEGASWALSRNLSGADVASTGAIPVLTGELPILSSWRDGRGDETDRSSSAGTGGAQASVDTSRKRRLPMVSKASGLPPSDSPYSRGRIVRFNPTVPALLIGIATLLVGSVWAFRTAFPGSAGELFEALWQSGPQSIVAEQSWDAGEEPETSVAGTVAPVISGIRVFSWSNDDGDHPELVGSLTDGDPGTVWRSRYFQENSFQEGSEIALLVVLEQPAVVSEIDMAVVGNGGEVVIRNSADGDPRTGEVLATGTLAPDTVIKLAQPTQLSDLGIQFMSLPVDDEGLFRAKVSNIEVK